MSEKEKAIYMVLGCLLGCALGALIPVPASTTKTPKPPIFSVPMPPIFEPAPIPYKLGSSMWATVNDFFHTMESSGHLTSWSTGDVTNAEGEETGKLFMYVSFDREQSEKVEATLRAAKLLCSTPLGFKLVTADGGSIVHVPLNTWRGAPWR